MQAWKKRILLSLGGRGTYYRINEGESPHVVSTLLESMENGKEKRKEEKKPQEQQQQQQQQQQDQQQQQQDQQQEEEKQTETQTAMEMEQKNDVNILEANEDDESKEVFLLSESSASSFENSSDMEEYIE